MFKPHKTTLESKIKPCSWQAANSAKKFTALQSILVFQGKSLTIEILEKVSQALDLCLLLASFKESFLRATTECCGSVPELKISTNQASSH